MSLETSLVTIVTYELKAYFLLNLIGKVDVNFTTSNTNKLQNNQLHYRTHFFFYF